MNDVASVATPPRRDIEQPARWGDPSNIDFHGTSQREIDITSTTNAGS